MWYGHTYWAVKQNANIYLSCIREAVEIAKRIVLGYLLKVATADLRDVVVIEENNLLNLKICHSLFKVKQTGNFS